MHNGTKLFWLLGALGLLVVAAILIRGCGGYGTISPRAYDYATALYTICNGRDESRLDGFSTLLEEARTAEEITEQEATWLIAIVDQARQGDWEEASASARRMLADQVEDGP